MSKMPLTPKHTHLKAICYTIHILLQLHATYGQPDSAPLPHLESMNFVQYVVYNMDYFDRVLAR